MNDQRFTRAHRILKRSVFRATYENGRRAHGRLAAIFCRRREDEGPWRLGLTATRKTGCAVVRNRLRRRAREYFRRCGASLPVGWDFVVNLKAAANDASWAEFARDLEGVLRRLGFDIKPNPEVLPHEPEKGDGGDDHQPHA